MTDPTEPQFDRYARDYHDLNAAAVRASGETPDYFAALKASYMSRAAPLPEDGALRAILDFGCGIGGGIPHLRRAFPDARLHGVDASGVSIAMARTASADAQFSVIEDNRLPLPDATFDLALAACVFHHIAPVERLHWMRELHRVLKPGGKLFVFEHNPLNPLTRKVVRECPFDEDAILLPRGEALALLADAGFREAKSDYIVFFPRMLAALRPLERWLSRLPLGAQYAAQGTAA
jgi:SAM-dependent methyltransferase